MARLNIDFEAIPQVAPTGGAPTSGMHIQANPAAFGAPVAQGLEKLGQGVERVAEAGADILNFHDKVSADYEVNNFIDARTKAEYGDPNRTVTGPDGKPTRDTGYFGLTGRAALDGQNEALSNIAQARQRGLDNLTSPRAKLLFDTETRRMYADSQMRISRHADDQQKTWAQGVNATGADLNLNGYAATIVDHPDSAEDFYHRYIDAQVKAAQLKFGNDPDIIKDVVAKSKQNLLETQVNAIAVKDPAGAIKVLDENKAIAGARYDDIYNKLRNRNFHAEGNAAANRYVAEATGAGELHPVAANFMRGPLPGPGDMETVDTAAGRITVHKEAVTDIKGFVDDLVAAGAPPLPVGSYNQRKIAGTETWSQHAYGTAIDYAQSSRDEVDPRFKTWADAHPDKLREIAAKHHMINGGDWSNPDFGHFEWAGPGGAAPAAGGVLHTGAAAAPESAAPTYAPPNRHLQLAEALRGLESDPNISDEARQIGRQRIQQEFHVLEIMDNQTTKAKSEANDKAASGYVTELADALHTPGSDLVALSGRISHDPNLNWQTRAHLLDRVTKYSGEEERIGFGPGFFDAKSRIMSPPGTPGHIGSVEDILNLPDNAVTMRGQHELATVFNAVRRGDRPEEVEAKHGVELSIRSKMVRPEEGGGFIKDLKGEQMFNGRFLPIFNKEYGQWVKDGKDPYEFLRDEKKINGLMEIAYPKKDRDRDAVFARGDANAEKGAPAEPLPPTPEKINPAGWVPIVGAPPVNANGKPWSVSEWGKTLQRLINNPSDEYKAAFKEKFGLDADEVLKKFKMPEAAGAPAPAPAAPTTAAPAPAPSSAPAQPEPPAPPAGETPEQRQQRYQAESAADIRQQEAQAESETARGRSEAAAAFETVGRARRERFLHGQQQAEERRRTFGEQVRRANEEQHLRNLEQMESLLADNIKSYRRMQENRNSEPGDRELAARRADKLQSELDATKVERQRLSR